MRTNILVTLALLCLCLPASAQMAESLREQFHSEKELGLVVVTDADIGRLPQILADPSVRMISLQVSPETLNSERAKAILTWVRTGRSIWIYDARLGPWFGFKPFMMTAEQFTHKPEEGQLGGHKWDGMATTVMAMGTHETLTGVGQCTVFLPEFTKGQYGALLAEGDTVPLLRFTLDSPLLAGLRREGRGLIVFKPLLWPEVLSGDRFQANLLDFSAGYQIPGPAGSDKLGNPPGPQAEYVTGNPALPLAEGPLAIPSPVAVATPTPARTSTAPSGGDLLTTEEGPMSGLILNESFRFETGDKSLTLTRAEIQAVILGSSTELDQLVLRDGTIKKGLLLTGEVKLNGSDGEHTYAKRKILKIELAPPAPQKPDPGH